MDMFDDMKDKTTDIMDDPAKRAKIEQIAKEKGMTIDEAKDHFMKHGDQQ